MRLILLCIVFALCASAAHSRPGALVVREFLANEGISEQVASQVSSAGYDVKTLDPGALDAAALSEIDLLVVTDSAHMPASAGKPIDNFLKRGGDIIALRAPLWQTSLVKLGEQWLSADEYQKKTAPSSPQHLLFGFKPESPESWQRTSNDMASTASWKVGEPGPAPGTFSAHCRIENMTGWDNWAVRDMEKPFADGDTLTVFSAKGGARTTQIAVEWSEKDGSRWIATVPLDSNWRRYVLRPEDFRFWQSNPNRGGRGDKFNPKNAATIAIGLAYSHTGAIGGEHEFWVGPLGTAGGEQAEELYSAKPEFEPQDLLYPSYKFFECTGVGNITSKDGAKLPTDGAILSPQPRPEGRGYGKGRDWRFITLATAKTTKGEWRGTPAAIMLHSPESPYKGGVWASFGWQDPSAYKSPQVLSLIKEAAGRIREGLFLLEGGTNFYTYFQDDPVTMGAQAVNVGSGGSSSIVVEQTFLDAGSKRPVSTEIHSADISAGETKKFEMSSEFIPKQGTNRWPKDGLVAVTRLLKEGKVIDEITHGVYQWTPKSRKSFITTKDGQFILNGRPWKAHGVNYMPSSGIGIEDGEYFEHWIGSKPYDPEIIQRDLEHIKDLNMNAVSIFMYSGPHTAGNLLDILRRCENLGIKVNLSLRPGYPMEFLWDNIRTMIERYRLWDNDTVFAYDLAWEPSFGGYQARIKYDPDWEKWITSRYGSLENAEADWGYPVPRTQDGKVTGPSDGQTVSEGDWKRMVVSYRRFVDDLLYKNYNKARMLVKSVDPNHLVSFRMSEAGNPTYNWDAFLPYDLAGIAPAVDFLAPEAYGRISDGWDKVKPGWFERIYACWAASEKPMIWAEAGVSAWDNSWMKDTKEKLDYQGAHYDQFYQMLIKSGANGVMFWWYPGGFRYGENSDFGLINPDGSDRQNTLAIRKYGKEFLSSPSVAKPNAWIEIDKDADPRGIYGVYTKAEDEFWKLISEGKSPGLKTKGTGTTSADCPMFCVGNTLYDGKGPLKYLNSAFDKVEIRDAEGKWTEVTDGSQITVDPTKPITARLLVTNLGESKWIKGDTTGSVEFVCHIGFGKMVTPIPTDVPKHDTITISDAKIADSGLGGSATVRLFMRARDRGEFGESIKVKLLPKK